MNKARNVLSALFVALAVFAWGACPLAAHAEESGVIKVSTADELKSALSSAGEGERVIRLADDIEAPGLGVSSTVTILGGGHTLTMSQYASIQVYSGAQLNLGAADGSDKLTIKGDGQTSNDTPGLLYVQGSCDMYSRVTLADREGNNYFGGGVTVEGGTFHMHGGTIENCGIKGGSMCYGGGVGVISGGTFVMDDGQIKDCYAKSSYAYGGMPQALGGGVFVTGGSTFIMNGGSISDNRATGLGGGVAIISSISEIHDGGFGSLKSYADLRNGLIEGNTGSDGAGVAVSAGYYAAYWGLCADAPSTGATEKQGLHIGKVSITDNKAGDEDCSGGGVLVFNVAAPATVSIDGATISGNSAAEGGGLAAYANGGLDTLTVTNAALCNNTAFSHGADVCTSRTKVSLSSARDMGENYLGKPDDVTGSRIDGWYVDAEDSRYAEQPASERQTFDGYASIGSDESVALVAASNNKLVKVSFTDESGDVTYGEGWYEPGTKADQIQVPTPTKDSDDTFDYVFDSWDSDITDVTSDAVYKAHFNKLRKRFGVKYAFSSATPGQQLPDEVLAPLPKDEGSYPRGSEIAAGTPSKTVVEAADGIWTFEGYDRDFVTAGMDDADDEGNVSFSGTWKFTKKSTPVQPGGDTPANPGASSPAAPNAPASASASSATALPQTSDPLGAGACLALLAAGVVALGAGVLAKK